jgi:pilus assembly protein TadC
MLVLLSMFIYPHASLGYFLFFLLASIILIGLKPKILFKLVNK